MSFMGKITKLSAGKKILVGLGAFCVIFSANFFLNYWQLQPLIPPEGYTYPNAATLVGVYDCCGNNLPNYAYSTVNGKQINCEKPGLGSSGHGRNRDVQTACWLQSLNGKTVSVEQKLLIASGVGIVPTGFFQKAYVSKIIETSTQKTYFERNDDELRKEWISNSIYGYFVTSFFLGLFVFIVVTLKLFGIF